MTAEIKRRGLPFSVHALLGVQTIVAALCEFVAEQPLIVALVGACSGLALLQFGVLAACTRGMRCRN